MNNRVGTICMMKIPNNVSTVNILNTPLLSLYLHYSTTTKNNKYYLLPNQIPNI